MLFRASSVWISLGAIAAIASNTVVCTPFSSMTGVSGAGADGGGASGSRDGGAGAIPDGLQMTPPAVESTVLAKGYAALSSITASETTVYFVEPSTKTIHQVPLDGSASAQSFYKRIDTTPFSALHFGERLYWTSEDKKVVGTLSLSGSPTNTEVSQDGIVTSSIYAGSTIIGYQLILLGKKEVKGVARLYKTLSNDRTDVELFSANPRNATVAGTEIYWTDTLSKSVSHIAPSDNSGGTVAGDEPGCDAIAADGLGVYWTRTDGNVRMLALPLTAGSEPTTLAINQNGPSSIVADATGVYWLTRDGKLQRFDRVISDALPPRPFAEGFASNFASDDIRAIALTSKYVVWITSDGKVLRRAKPS